VSVDFQKRDFSTVHSARHPPVRLYIGRCNQPNRECPSHMRLDIGCWRRQSELQEHVRIPRW